jgi:periplasmic protein TonB
MSAVATVAFTAPERGVEPTSALQALRLPVQISAYPSRRRFLRFMVIALCHAAVVMLATRQLGASKPLTVVRAQVLELRAIAAAVDGAKPMPMKVAKPSTVAPTQRAKAMPAIAAEATLPDVAVADVSVAVPRHETPNATVVQPSSIAASSSPSEIAAATLQAPPSTPAKSAMVPPKIELPSATAAYLSNPPPPYPAASKRLKETGSVLLRVWVTAEGAASQVELRQTSGYDRLDDAAIAAVRQWKFVPGQRNGVATAMWVNVPVTFELR